MPSGRSGSALTFGPVKCSIVGPHITNVLDLHSISYTHTLTFFLSCINSRYNHTRLLHFQGQWALGTGHWNVDRGLLSGLKNPKRNRLGRKGWRRAESVCQPSIGQQTGWAPLAALIMPPLSRFAPPPTSSCTCATSELSVLSVHVAGGKAFVFI